MKLDAAENAKLNALIFVGQTAEEAVAEILQDRKDAEISNRRFQTEKEKALKLLEKAGKTS